jgi:hypothetical protein
MIHAALWVASFLFLCVVGLVALSVLMRVVYIVVREGLAIIERPFVLLNAFLDRASKWTSKWKRRRLAAAVDAVAPYIAIVMFFLVAFSLVRFLRVR